MKYEALDAEEPEVTFLSENQRRYGQKQKQKHDSSYQELSMGEAEVEGNGDWNSIRTDDFSEDGDSEDLSKPHTHFFSFFGRRYSVPSFLSLHSFTSVPRGWLYVLMAIISLSALLGVLQLFTIVQTAPVASPQQGDAAPTAPYWLSVIEKQGFAAFGQPGYQVYRNVKDYGARGDGVTDDTLAINAAMSAGGRCGQGCDSQTTTPLTLYFPPGVYSVSRPINVYYYTQMIGDGIDIPTIKATANFQGMAVIDANPYADGGINWHMNTNNFFNVIQSFIIDLTAMPVQAGAGIHWQVAQATTLQKITFNMRTDGGDANAQQGIFMDNGSGGFMTDLVFNGGKYGAFLGSQQFTTRNLKFNNCKTAIFMNWNWVWTFAGLEINNCGIGIDMANGGSTQTVGSVLIIDSTITNTPVGILTAYNPSQVGTNGSLVIDNVDFSQNVPVAVQQSGSLSTLLSGNTKVTSWVQGREYKAVSSGRAVQGPSASISKPANLLDSAGRVFTRSKPLYETVPVSAFRSVKNVGAKGDGATDDTSAIQAAFDAASATDIVYFPHGAYLVTRTIKVPKNIRIVGEHWPLIMAAGTSTWQDQNSPQPVFKVGEVGETGAVEFSNLIFETMGPQPGAILMEWNLGQSSQGSNGLWDVHFRIGGTAGTKLQSDTCAKNPQVIAGPKPECVAAFLLFHVTSKGSVYVENCWFWVSDHELDRPDFTQINIYNGRGVLIESEQGPVWLWGTASEHNVLYNYQINNAANVFMAHIQTETPYYQSNPDATVPFASNAKYADPVFNGGVTNNKAWGLRVLNSKDVFLYGGGLYSFFENYDQTCVPLNNCQDNMVDIQSSTGVHLYGLSTKAAVNQVTVDGRSAALDSDNRNNFCAAIALFDVAGTTPEKC